jgi:hypothetical protein
MDPSKTVFDIEVDLSTFQIVSFQFLLKNDPGFGDFFSQRCFRHLQGKDKHWIRIKVNFKAVGVPEYCGTIHCKPFSPKELSSITDDSGGPFPEWPWVAAHLTRKQERSNWVVVKKWDLLITAVHCLRLKHPRDFETFKAPKLKIGEPFRPGRMNTWYQTMCRQDVWDTMAFFGYVKRTLDREETYQTSDVSFGEEMQEDAIGSYRLNLGWTHPAISLALQVILGLWWSFGWYTEGFVNILSRAAHCVLTMV